ncbi:MAG: glycerol-3-phosphate acyltransferase, partial [Macromonas bipunctata]|nr:glycerol-3-phosphate acyltransferase [Macromonas bipunctata]
LLGLDTALVWIGMAVGLRYSSLAALTAALFAPSFLLLANGSLWQVAPTVVLATAVMSLLLLWRHRGNINRLLAGQESKIGSKKG